MWPLFPSFHPYPTHHLHWLPFHSLNRPRLLVPQDLHTCYSLHLGFIPPLVRDLATPPSSLLNCPPQGDLHCPLHLTETLPLSTHTSAPVCFFDSTYQSLPFLPIPIGSVSHLSFSLNWQQREDRNTAGLAHHPATVPGSVHAMIERINQSIQNPVN